MPRGARRKSPFPRDHFFSFFSAFSGFSGGAASAASSSVSCLPFLITSGSAGTAAASAATASGVGATSSLTEMMCATGWLGSLRNFSLPLCGRSATRITLPNTSSVTSASMELGISSGRHSTSTSRVTCSRIPPCCLTPAASPLSTMGTRTCSFWSMAMRFRSTCSSEPLMGSCCQSTIMARVRSPSSASSKMVLWPVADCRMRAICLGSSATATGSFLAPYTTPGTRPPRRTRRASFLPLLCRGLASNTLLSFVAVAINLSPALHEQFADRCFLVNGLDGARDKPGDGAHLALGLAARRLAQMDGVGHDNLLDIGLGQILHGRPGKHGMGGAGEDPAGAVFLQGARSLDQGAGGVNQVVNQQAGAAVDVADNVHDLGDVHFHPPFIHDGEGRIHLFGEEPGPLHAARVRGNHGQRRQRQFFEVVHQHRRSEQVVHRNVEEALDLGGMQI